MLPQLYIVEWDLGADYTCQACAVQFAADNGLTWNNENGYNFTEESPNGLHTYADYFGQVELDCPIACECGEWLNASLTAAGVDYLNENAAAMPAAVLENYRIGANNE